MSQNIQHENGRRFLSEALPLVASYFSGETVQLAGIEVSLGEESDTESELFASQIRLRHAITCCTELLLIVNRIEECVSTVNRIVRAETKGMIRGRLDIPRYVVKRSASLSWPKTYPILISEESPSTPENSLTSRVLRILYYRLSEITVPPKTAEAASARWYRNWLSNRLKREPWCNLVSNSSLQRLRMETLRRITRRQTGNERAYSDLLSLIEEWRLLGHEIGGATKSERFVNALLSFPSDESFLDRIYEIWCIREISTCLADLGAVCIDGPTPLTESRKLPIYTFQLAEDRIEVWFQRSMASDSAVWSYEKTKQPLRGIPDITLIANGSHYLLIDAKNRLVTGNTRSEETYKMLGYFENFRPTLDKSSCWGVLAFISYHNFLQSLDSTSGRKLAMISANPNSALDCAFKQQLADVLRKWMDTWHTAS